MDSRKRHSAMLRYHVPTNQMPDSRGTVDHHEPEIVSSHASSLGLTPVLTDLRVDRGTNKQRLISSDWVNKTIDRWNLWNHPTKWGLTNLSNYRD